MSLGNYYVYILVNETGTVLYIGVTNDLERRLSEHRHASPDRFAGRYRTHKLVYCENYSDIDAAIAREKQLKGWSRQKKIDLITGTNPDWRDLSVDWS